LRPFFASHLTGQHFWDQMDVVPVGNLAAIEDEMVREMVRIEQLQLAAVGL
jgi:hypothetical protein